MTMEMREKSRRTLRTLRDARGGFTLVELLVVLVILGLIMGLVGPQVLGYIGTSREKAARTQIGNFASALDLYFLDVGRYPSASEGLEALVRKPGSAERWSGPYLRVDAVPRDPWGNPYEYRLAGSGARTPYVITSFGADGKKGGTDDAADISNE